MLKYYTNANNTIDIPILFHTFAVHFNSEVHNW